MRKLSLTLLTVVLLHLFANAQGTSAELDELNTPSTPAFTILGLSPTDVSRPTLAKPFLMDLANGLDGKSIASDIAIETAPFWWFPQHELTFEKYYGLDTASSFHVLDYVQQSFSFSLATNDASPDIDSIDSRNIAFGVRFQVLPGKPSQAFKTNYNYGLKRKGLLENTLDDLIYKVEEDEIQSLEGLNNSIATSVENIISTHQTSLPESTADWLTEEVVEVLQTYSGDFEKTKVLGFLNAEKLKVGSSINAQLIEMETLSKVGWMWEFAAAAVLNAPTNNIEYTFGQDWAVWSTLTYRLDSKEGSANFNDFNLMFRYGGNFQNDQTFNTDIGLSWALSGNNHSLTVEGVFRNYTTYFDIEGVDGNVYETSESEATWRLALAYQYRITDYLNVALTLGKDYENSTLASNGFFSLLNLNLVLPTKQELALKQ